MSEQDAARESAWAAFEAPLWETPYTLMPTVREVWEAAWTAGVAHGRAEALAEMEDVAEAFGSLGSRIGADAEMRQITAGIRDVVEHVCAGEGQDGRD